MTNTHTDIDLNRRQQDIPHLENVSEEGWLLKWPQNGTTDSTFEIICRQANAMQIKNLDELVSAALPKAAEVLK